LGRADPSVNPEAMPLYAVACRGTKRKEGWLVDIWAHGLAVGQPLPTLPLWLADNFAVPLGLEASYEEACRGLRLPCSRTLKKGRPLIRTDDHPLYLLLRCLSPVDGDLLGPASPVPPLGVEMHTKVYCRLAPALCGC